ncbi:MAG TPA: winged helix-turn-helix domain-containing protein [Candidatus Aquilonibacter sp.]|nr:winged helix-turn-helix domain-containing protein [Candidatus Aquilonibacter sp.]
MTAASYQFGEFELDCERFELRRNGTPLRLERQPMELLILLASSGGRLVTRDEIARSLWPTEVFVDTEHGINTAIRKIRHTLREHPDNPRFLQTVTGKGYRFVGVAALNPSAISSPATNPVVPSAREAANPGVSHLASATRASSRHPLWFAAAAALLIVVAAITFGTRSVRGHTAPRPIDPAAREAYLRGRYLWFSNQEPASGPYFLKATQLAPNYAPAWAALANYYGAGMVDGDFDPRQSLSLEDASAHRAEQLDDALPDTHLALAASHWIVDWNYPLALHELDRAIQLDPKFSEAIHLRGKLLGQLNRHDEAIAAQRAAMDINPLERPWALAYFLLLARRWDACIAEAQQRLEGHPNTFTWAVLSEAYRAKGMEKESEYAAEQSLIFGGNPSAADAIHRAFLRGGPQAVLSWRLADLTAQSQKHYVSPFQFALLYARLGDKQQALSYLDATVREHSPMIFDLQNDTAFDSLHSNPHYRAIVQKVGLPPAW